MDWYSWYNISCLSIINKSKAKNWCEIHQIYYAPRCWFHGSLAKLSQLAPTTSPGSRSNTCGTRCAELSRDDLVSAKPLLEKTLAASEERVECCFGVRKPERLNLRGQAARGSSWTGLFARAYPRNAHASGVHAHCRGHYNFILCAAILDRILSNLIFRSWCG